jgi:hypothetical protein
MTGRRVIKERARMENESSKIAEGVAGPVLSGGRVADTF